jgi:methylated-DNA-[protein]-cysteine S-methyltransferase
MNSPFFIGDGGTPISTPHTLWAKNRFLSTAAAAQAAECPELGPEDALAGNLVSLSAAGSFFPMETLHTANMNSAIGPLFLAASAHGLVALEFDARLTGQQSIRPNPRDLRREKEKEKEKKGFRFEDSPRPMRLYVSQVEEYFAGKRRGFDFPLDLRGTDFQLACWRALLAIPFGETRTYADIARAIGKPNAFRAVGMANHSNPIAIVVPCHRVIASDGTLCGYGGGLDVKRKLLELEGAFTGVLAA